MVMAMARPAKLSGSPNHYARKVVPADVRGIIGRTEFRKVLSGATPSERLAHHRSLMADWEAQIQAARAKVRGDLRTLTAREAEVVCAAYYRAEVTRHEDNPGDAEHWEAVRDALIDRLGGHEPGEPVPEFEPERRDLEEAEDLLRSQGIAADAPSLHRVASRLWATKVNVADTLIRRARGDWGQDDHLLRLPAPPAPAPADPAKSGAAPVSFGDLLAAWAAERRPAANTLRTYRKTLNLLRGAVGEDDARKVTVETVRKFKAARLAAGLNPGTVADDILAAGAVFRWGVTNGLLSANPFAGMAPRPVTRGERPRDGYTDAEAARILEAARGETGWLRWVPWLLCFTGARISEVLHLRRQDVRQEDDTWILDVRPTAERAGKNVTFQRMLPIHPAVLAEGFLSFVEQRPAEEPLFGALKTTTATTAFGRWVRNVAGVTRERTAPSHSFRHRMEDELRRVRALPEIQDAITGRHNPRNAGAAYGRGFRGMPGEVLKELQRIRSPLSPKTLAATPPSDRASTLVPPRRRLRRRRVRQTAVSSDKPLQPVG